MQEVPSGGGDAKTITCAGLMKIKQDTRAGVVMLATILRSDVAVQVTKLLVEVLLQTVDAKANSVINTEAGQTMLEALRPFAAGETEGGA